MLFNFFHFCSNFVGFPKFCSNFTPELLDMAVALLVCDSSLIIVAVSSNFFCLRLIAFTSSLLTLSINACACSSSVITFSFPMASPNKSIKASLTSASCSVIGYFFYLFFFISSIAFFLACSLVRLGFSSII